MLCDYCPENGEYSSDLRSGVRVCDTHYSLIKRLEEHRIPKVTIEDKMDAIITLDLHDLDLYDYTDPLLQKPAY